MRKVYITIYVLRIFRLWIVVYLPVKYDIFLVKEDIVFVRRYQFLVDDYAVSYKIQSTSFPYS
jgi:hypothetical protein